MKVLVVDDDPDIQMLVAMKLRQAGHEAITEDDGEAGLERALAEHPDLVLLDVTLPKLSGIEGCQRLRASSSTE